MDQSLFRSINRLADRTGWAHGLMRLNAHAGIVVFAVLLLAAFFDGRLHGRSIEIAGSVWAGGAALVALGIGQIIGGAVARLRPYETMTDVHVLVARTTDFSFPSDHATAAGAVAAGLLFTNRRWGIPALIAAVAMAFTRVYVGAHYPGDVLAGLALGLAVAAAGQPLVRYLAWVVERVAAGPLRPLVSTHIRVPSLEASSSLRDQA